MINFTSLLADVFVQNPAKVALLAGERSWTYYDLSIQARLLASEWTRLGAASADRVLLLPVDRAGSLIAILASAYGGFDLVSLSEKASADEIAHAREATRPTLVWSSDLFSGLNTAAAFDSATAFHNIRLIFFTSGTTSRPKGVCHQFETMLANAAAFNRRALLSEEVRLLHVMPSGYMAGVLNTFLSPLLAAGTVILGDAFSPLTALQFWSLARQHSINAVWLSPTMTAMVTKLARGQEIQAWARDHLCHVFVGTAPLHQTTRMAFQEHFGVDCLESYGMTECMFASVNPPDVPNPGHSVGLLLDGVEAQARSEDGTELGPDIEGEIWIRSRTIMEGYLNADSGQPDRGFDPDAWLATGDLGIIAADGRLTITGRIKDLIIRGGVNISPKAVEDVILAFPGVSDVAVIGSPHPFWGEEIIGFVIPADSGSMDINALTHHCSQRLPADAMPSRFVTLAQFPRSRGGKIQKHLLRRLGV